MSEQEEKTTTDTKKRYELIEDIPGIGPATAEKLRELGFHTVESLATATVKELTQAGIGEKQAAKIITVARDTIATSFVRADELMKMRQNLLRLSMTSKQLDELVGGGLESQTITEFYGEYGVGKCSAKDTPVLYFNDEHPHLATLEDIYTRCRGIFEEERWGEGFRIPSLGFKAISFVDGGLRRTDAPFLYREHASKLIRISTRQGRKLRVTPAHRLLTVTRHGLEWTRAGELQPGMSIGCPKILEYSTTNAICEDDAYFLGIYVAEGSWSGGVSTSNKRLVKWLRAYIRSQFGYIPTISSDQAGWNVNLRKSTKMWLGQLHGTVASSKFVPEAILNGSLRLVKSFLAGYIDGDGHFENGRGLEITTKSEKLASQVAYLLLRLGAQSKLTLRTIRGEHYYRLYVARNWAYKLVELPYKIARPHIQPKCERRVYPTHFGTFLRQLYRNTVGGGRGRRKKRFGRESANRVFRLVLTRNAPRARVSEKVLKDIVRLFARELRILKTAKTEAENLSGSNFKRVDHLIPFPLRSIAEESGISKNALNRFQARGLPRDPEFARRIGNAIVPEIHRRILSLEEGLHQIKLVCLFDWDPVVRLDMQDYNDYVYDLFVPEGNAYVGGNLPTLLHNSILCHQLAVNAQLPIEQGGLNGGALYLDTENTFRPEWIVRMAGPLGLDPETVGKNIIYSEAFNSDHQILILEKADKIIQDNNIKLIIVDSLTAHFRSEYLGREMLAERQQKLNSHMHRLVRLARAFNAVAVVTNQVMSKPDAFFGGGVEAVGGHIVAHTCLHPSTLVQLADGTITKISSVHNPLTLTSLDLDGNLQSATGRCTGVWKTQLPEILHIRAGFDIKASPNHRFFRLRELDVAEVQAKDLRAGEYLAYQRKIEVKGAPQALTVVEPKQFYRLMPRGSEILKSALRAHRVTREQVARVSGLSKRTLRRVLNQQFPAEKKAFQKMSELAGLGNTLLDKCVPHYSHKWRPLRIPSRLDNELAQALGYVLGDGHLGERSVRIRDERLPVLKAYKKIFAKIFGVNGTIAPIPGKRCYQLAISSVEITNLFKGLLRDWKDIVPRSPRDCVASFIRGFVDAEGSVQEWLHIAQSDRSVLEILQMLLLRFGVKSTLARVKGSFLLRVAEGTSLANFKKEIGLTAPDKARKLAKIVVRKSRIGGDLIPIDRQILWDLAKSVGMKPSKFVKHRQATAITRSSLARLVEQVKRSRGYKAANQDVVEKVSRLERLVNSPIGWEKIRSISREKADVPVYDITVSPHANFLANGLLVHNSHTRIFLRRATGGPVRIARLVSSPYLPEGERIFKITEEGIKDVTEEDEVKRRR